MDKPLNLIILGPQGSGKGTQAQMLAKRFNLAFLGSGDLLREIAKTDTLLGREVHQTINVEGRHMRSEVISQVIKEKLHALPRDQGVILESYPRNLEQYEEFKKFWPETERGHKRLELFNSLTKPMIEEMDKQNRVIRIDGAPSIEQVNEEILSKLNEK